MMHHLPPLKAVRAFEACYRLGSYTRAAALLNVQQPAVSHQIRLLEEDLGLPLFSKKGTGVAPTEAAHDYYRTISAALGDIERASQRLRRQGRGEGVTLATYPGLASYWVLPRLASLRKRAPDVVVRLTTAEMDADIPLGDVDCAILFGEGQWPGFHSRPLISEKVVPVANPRLLEEIGGRSPVELLERGPLIHLEDPENRWFNWADWKAAFAPEARLIDRGISVTNHGIAIHQALLGNGIALAWVDVVADLLNSGVLAALHEVPLESARGYHLLLSPEFEASDACQKILQAFAVA